MMLAVEHAHPSSKRKAEKPLCSASSVSVFALSCSSPLLMGGTLLHLKCYSQRNSTSFSFSLRQFIWLEENTPPYSSAFQIAAGRLRTYDNPGEGAQWLTSSLPLLVSLSPHPLLHPPWYEATTTLSSPDRNGLISGSPNTWSSVLHSITVRSGHGTQASREESQLRSGEHHLRQELRPGKHPESCCTRSRQA